MNLYPQTDLNNRNLGWIIDEIKKIQAEIASGGIQVVSLASDMTNHNVIYVYIGSEVGMNTDHWYYWDTANSAWADGGAWGGASITLPLAISDGGTGSTTASAARTALGITPANIGAVSTGATIDIPHGGTGSTTAAAARTALGITPANIGAEPAITTLPVSKGGTNASTAADARSNLGITPVNIGAVPTSDLPLSIANGGTGATTAAGARNALGLGNTAGALPIANGGTGATTAAAARNALGLGAVSGVLTPSGDILSEIQVLQMGNVVEVKGYASFSDAIAANTETAIGTISGVSLPPSLIRTMAGSATQHAYDAYNIAYCSLGPSGVISVKTTLSTQRTFTFNLVYLVP